MRGKRIITMVLAAAMTLSFAACGSSTGSYASTADNAGTADFKSEESASDTGDVSAAKGSGSDISAAAQNRKIVYTSSLAIECKDVEKAADSIRSDVSAAGGYIESSSKDAETSYILYCITARIPADKYADFMANTGNYGNVTGQNEQTDDITENYVDVQAHIQALENQRDSLNTLLANAADLDSVLKIESQLSDVQYQLDSYEAQLKLMDSQVDYCTVSFNLSQPTIVTPVSELFGDKVAAAWSNGIHAFVQFLEGIVLLLVSLAPFLALAAVIAFIVVKIRKKHPHAPKQPRRPVQYAQPSQPVQAPRPNMPGPGQGMYGQGPQKK